jgi:hypothetical protein
VGDDWHPSSSSPNLDIGFVRGVVVQAACGSLVVRTQQKEGNCQKRGSDLWQTEVLFGHVDDLGLGSVGLH